MNSSKEDRTAISLEDRPTMNKFAGKQEEKGEMHNYQAEWNASSLDGLPGLKVARRDNGERLWLSDLRTRVRGIRAQRQGIAAGMIISALLMYLFTAVARMIPVRIPGFDGGWMICHEI